PNLTVAQPGPATLNGQVSDDGLPAGATLTVQWSKVSGPGTVTFASPNAAFTTATFSATGTYVLQLSANDSQLATTASTTVTVNPAAPQLTVSAGNNQLITLPAAAQLIGTVVDSTGTPTLQWTEVSGPGA